MTTIDLTIIKDRRKRAVQRARERNIVIPTFTQMKEPSKVPARVKAELARIGLWDVAPRNLFHITWHNQPKESGGGFGGVNYLELPSSLTGVPARPAVDIRKSVAFCPVPATRCRQVFFRLRVLPGPRPRPRFSCYC